MRAKELRERTDEELQTMERTLRAELCTSRFKNHTGQLVDSSELPKKRRDRARVLTILRERELAGAPEQGSTEGGEG